MSINSNASAFLGILKAKSRWTATKKNGHVSGKIADPALIQCWVRCTPCPGQCCAGEGQGPAGWVAGGNGGGSCDSGPEATLAVRLLESGRAATRMQLFWGYFEIFDFWTPKWPQNDQNWLCLGSGEQMAWRPARGGTGSQALYFTQMHKKQVISPPCLVNHSWNGQNASHVQVQAGKKIAICVSINM